MYAGSASGAEANPDKDVLILLSSADRRGAEIQGRALTSQLNAAGRRAECLALTAGSGKLDGVSILGSEPLSLATLRALRRRASTASLVVAFGSRTLAACAIGMFGLRVPFIYRSIGSPSSWVRGAAHRQRTRLLYRRAEHVAVLWPGAGDELVRLYGVAPDRISAIPNARDADHFAPATNDERAKARRDLGHDDDRPLIVALGALTEEKQIERAIEAMEFIPEGRLLIVGDGPERERLTSVAAKGRSDNVSFFGRVDDPRPILRAADVLLMTSRTEGMPGAIIEAGLSGIPAVAPRVGAVGDMVVDGTSGVILPTDTPTAVAAGLRKALAKRVELGRQAQNSMRSRFTWTSVLPSWLELFDTVEARGRGAAGSH